MLSFFKPKIPTNIIDTRDINRLPDATKADTLITIWRRTSPPNVLALTAEDFSIGDAVYATETLGKAETRCPKALLDDIRFLKGEFDRVAGFNSDVRITFDKPGSGRDDILWSRGPNQKNRSKGIVGQIAYSFDGAASDGAFYYIDAATAAEQEPAFNVTGKIQDSDWSLSYENIPQDAIRTAPMGSLVVYEEHNKRGPIHFNHPVEGGLVVRAHFTAPGVA